MWNGQDDSSAKNGCCTSPIVKKETCVDSLRKYCSVDSPSQTRVMNYAFSPGSCDGHKGPINMTSPDQDIANFLLIRGPHAFLGHGWLGCSRIYTYPEKLNWDYGTPLGLCKETSSGSGVFVREWTNSKITMDCNTWTPTFEMK